MCQMSTNLHQWEIIESKGPFHFTTWRIYRHPDGTTRIWSSRHHRKCLSLDSRPEGSGFWATVWRSLWMVQTLNWWIGMVFALGSSLFMLASVLILWPDIARKWLLSSAEVNTIFFIGSIPFTTAAYLQLYQAVQSEKTAIHQGQRKLKARWIGWYPSSVGWLSAVTQFLGTLLFNVSTLAALLPHLDWLQQDGIIWAPDFAGSVLFLVSGYLAYIEFGHTLWVWNPARISWWVVTSNLFGCIAFMISAFFAFVPPATSPFNEVTISVSCTLVGALFFFCGSLLMLPESAA